MTAPENDPFWFQVEKDIPELGAAAGDLVMVDVDPAEVWVCRQHGSTLSREHKPSLHACGPNKRDYFEDGPQPVIPSAVTEPIKARSDLAALFELIHSAGGRMPGEVAQ